MPTKVAEGGYVMLNQFANEDTLGALPNSWTRIWNDTEGTVTHFIAAMGTRNHKYLKLKNQFRLWALSPAMDLKYKDRSSKGIFCTGMSSEWFSYLCG
jgi:cysteine synthase